MLDALPSWCSLRHGSVSRCVWRAANCLPRACSEMPNSCLGLSVLTLRQVAKHLGWGIPGKLEQKVTRKESVEYLSEPSVFAFAMNYLNSQCIQALKGSDLFSCHKKPNKPSFLMQGFYFISDFSL